MGAIFEYNQTDGRKPNNRPINMLEDRKDFDGFLTDR